MRSLGGAATLVLFLGACASSPSSTATGTASGASSSNNGSSSGTSGASSSASGTASSGASSTGSSSASSSSGGSGGSCPTVSSGPCSVVQDCAQYLNPCLSIGNARCVQGCCYVDNGSGCPLGGSSSASSGSSGTSGSTSGSTGGTSSSSSSSSGSSSGSTGLIDSGPIVINGETGTVVDGLHITNPSGDCVVIEGHAQNITIQRSEIGPCAGRAIGISDSTNITVVDSYIHAELLPSSCCDTGDGVFAQNVDTLLVQGNVIAYNETNIELAQVLHAQVVGNFLLNPLGPFPRGQQVQSWGSCSDINVIGNYTIASDDGGYLYPPHQEDAVNFGFTDGIVARDNYVTGGQSNSGCGIIADEAANNASFTNNTLIGTGQCGIGIASGTGQTVTGNKILNTYLPSGSGNTALYIWSQYSDACGPVDLENNIAYGEKPNGTPSSYWNGGGCDPVTDLGNTWDAAAQTALSPASSKEPPPQIPPQPYACVAKSPYSNATSAAPCF